jgi:uncharacterized protein
MTTARRIVLLAVPPLLVVVMCVTFRTLAAVLGQKVGYFASFLFYWLVWCALIPTLLLGTHGVRKVFSSVRQPLGRPAWGGVLALAVPLVLGYGYAFPRAIPRADVGILVTSACLALVNGTLEELLWRGTFAAAFPASAFLGSLYPSFWFAVWHYAPQSLFQNRAPGGATSLVFVAGGVGLLWSWLARRTGSTRATTLSDVLFDFSGLGARVYAAA